MIKLTEIQYREYKLDIIATKYQSNQSLAIIAVDSDTYEMYTPISINLEEYGSLPDKYWIVLNHDLSDEFKTQIFEVLANPDTKTYIQYGYAKSFMMHLDDKFIRMLEQEEPNE